MFKIPVSNGEIVDKFTILNIKLNKINDSKKIIYIKKELCFLNKYVNEITTKYKIEELIGRKVSFYLASKYLSDKDHIVLFNSKEK